ncbi:restriction endonuclease subunit S (plasmid) [Roseomonas mucosa]|uniref:restriction endonuclease subunit S n=1 Tax=Roseomonas mucosa TaxID=207340 RepID=UPI0030CD798E
MGVLKTSCVYSGIFDPKQNKAVIPEEYRRASCPLRAGRLIVSRMNTPDLVGAAGLVREAPEGLYLPDRLWQISLRQVVPTFVYYWTRSFAYRSQVQVACSGTSSSMQNLSQPQFLTFDFPFPPLAEQSSIADFLDRETGKIDALVAEQERLIALLKEKRQAIISQAVTKGLDPNVPMKDSGVEWLGEVPAHWEVHRLSRRCGFASGKAHEPFIDAEGSHICVTARFVSTQGVEERRCTQNLTPARRGDILMVMSDLPNGRALARTFLVRDDQPYAVNQRVCAVTPRVDDSAFLSYQLNRSQWLLRNDDGVNQTHLSNDDFRKLPLWIPPLHEQHAIASFLDEMTESFSRLAAEAERAITLLRERRAALISAAVTGKIDVRDLAAQPEAQAA